MASAEESPTAPDVPAPGPAAYGRVDPDGTVWVRTRDGERKVGTWLAGDPEAGLAHFVRRYEGMLAEVALLEARLDGGRLDADHARATLAKLREHVAGAAAVGDLDGLSERLDALEAHVGQAADRASAARAEHRERLAARKRALVEEAEHLADTADWKVAGDRIRAIAEEFRSIHGVDRGADSALWKRYAVARDTFARRRGAHFAELDRRRDAARLRKEEIAAEAEGLAESTDWGPAVSRMKALMAEWKEAGPAGRDVDATLWTRFRTAQDTFFRRRSEQFAERDSGLRDNLARKEALLVEAEAIDPADAAAQRRMRDVLERWERVGQIPREALARVDGRLRTVQQRIAGAAEAAWRRSSPEAVARAEATVGQLRESITKLEAQAGQARQGGRTAAAEEAERAAAARRSWLAEAERTLADLRGR